MKLILTTATIAAIATGVAADQRYSSVTPSGADTPVLNIPASNERYQSVTDAQAPSVASQGSAGDFETVNSATPGAASAGLKAYHAEKERLQNTFR